MTEQNLLLNPIRINARNAPSEETYLNIMEVTLVPFRVNLEDARCTRCAPDGLGIDGEKENQILTEYFSFESSLSIEKKDLDVKCIFACLADSTSELLFLRPIDIDQVSDVVLDTGAMSWEDKTRLLDLLVNVSADESLYLCFHVD